MYVDLTRAVFQEIVVVEMALLTAMVYVLILQGIPIIVEPVVMYVDLIKIVIMVDVNVQVDSVIVMEYV